MAKAGKYMLTIDVGMLICENDVKQGGTKVNTIFSQQRR